MGGAPGVLPAYTMKYSLLLLLSALTVKGFAPYTTSESDSDDDSLYLSDAEIMYDPDENVKHLVFSDDESDGDYTSEEYSDSEYRFLKIHPKEAEVIESFSDEDVSDDETSEIEPIHPKEKALLHQGIILEQEIGDLISDFDEEYMASDMEVGFE